MDAWLTRMYERFGPRYPWLVIIGATVAIMLITPLVFIPPAIYEVLSLEQWAVGAGCLAVGALLVCGWMIFRTRSLFADLSAWAGGDRSPGRARAAAEAAFTAPRRCVAVAAPWVFLLGIPIGVLAATLPNDRLTVEEAAEIAVGGAIGGLFLILVGHAATEIAFRPIRAGLHLVTPLAGPLGLSTRFWAVVIVFPVLAGIVVGAGSVTRETGSLWEVYAWTLGATLGGIVVLGTLLSTAVVYPIRDLIAGTNRVALGDLGRPLAVMSDDELGELVGSFNTMVAGLRERESLRGENVELVDALRASRSRIVAAADESRRRVERDLHDGAQQSLVLLNLKLGLLEKQLGGAAADTRQLAAELRADLDGALAELRDLAHGIYPQVLTTDGLPVALAEAAEQAPIAVEASLEGVGRYQPEVEAAVYFCCLEALQNAGKHAGEGATGMINLSEAGDGLRFEVADDGAGFDIPSANGSAGLQNMADRIGALGGELTVESRPGKGTRVTGIVPITQD